MVSKFRKNDFSQQIYSDSRLYNNNLNIVKIPYVEASLSTRRLLTMEFLSGQRIQVIKECNSEFRNQVARNFFIAWYYPLYHFGLVHGDPHLGNYTINEDASINLFDFGCMRRFEYKFIQGVFELYQGLLRQDRNQIMYAYELWGFQNLSNDLLETLNLWAQLFYDPILDDRVRSLQADHRGHHGRNVAAQVYQQLQNLGGIKPPREFVFMDRATVGIGAVCMQIKAELNWYQLFHEIVQETSFRNYLTK